MPRLTHQQQLAALRRVTILDNSLGKAFNGEGGVVDQLQILHDTVNSLVLAQSNALPFPVGNLLFNGEMGHSVYTWHEVAKTPSGNKNAECVWFYSHNQPFEAQTFNSTDVNTGANTIAIDASEMTTGATCDLLLSGGSLPAPLAISTTYFIIKVSDTSIKLASTIAFAEAGTAIDITTTGTAAETFTVQQQLISTDSRTSSTNNELKTTAHSTFNPRYSLWDSVNGQGDFTGTTSIDILMPTNNVDSTTPLARVSLIAARANSYIEIPTDSSMVAGVWDNTSGQRKFLTGDIGFNVQVIGTPGTTQRKFKALLTSDRGFQLLSDEIVINNSLADGLLTSTDFIQMSWQPQAGQLQVDIYEYYTPDTQYRLIAQVSSSTSFIYQGNVIENVSGYPTPTGSTISAIFPTQTADMSDLAINNVSPTWDTVNFPIGVPSNYNKGATTNRQWVRLWNTVAANIFIPDGVITDGSDTIVIPDNIINTAAFASGGYGTGISSLYFNLEVEVYDADDVLLITTNIADPVSNTSLVLNDGVPATSNGKLRIIGGGFHGILIDKVHLGYQQNTTYAPNAQDNRTLQPVAAPSSSGQGGGTGGGTGGGINPCVVGDTPIEQFDRVVGSLDRAAGRGKLAKNTLKAETITDLLDSSYNAASRTIQGERTFSGVAFSKRFDQLEPKLKRLFSEEEFSQLQRMRKQAEDLVPPSGAVPKGSAGFFIDAANQLGIFALMNKVPTVGPIMANQIQEMGRNAQRARIAGEAVSGYKPPAELSELVRYSYPALATGLGVQVISEEE